MKATNKQKTPTVMEQTVIGLYTAVQQHLNNHSGLTFLRELTTSQTRDTIWWRSLSKWSGQVLPASALLPGHSCILMKRILHSVPTILPTFFKQHWLRHTLSRRPLFLNSDNRDHTIPWVLKHPWCPLFPLPGTLPMHMPQWGKTTCLPTQSFNPLSFLQVIATHNRLPSFLWIRMLFIWIHSPTFLLLIVLQCRISNI